MPLNARLLTAGLLQLAAGLAGCASTSSGPSGAQQDAAELAAAPESSSGSPSADSTPTGSPSADSTPDASPAASSTESSSASADPSSDSASDPDGSMPGQAMVRTAGTTPPNNDKCDQGLAHACGDTGPGGGVVFYASSTAFGCGPGMASSCNFLEVAPNGWNGKKVDCPMGGCANSKDKTSDWGSESVGSGRGYEYCSGMGEKNLIPDASNSAIGAGYANTQAMVANCRSGDAGQLAQSYTGGGLNDWYLPSLDELGALYYYPNRNAIGGFAANWYWSSTQATSRNAYYINFSKTPEQNEESKTWATGVRPVRAF